MPISIYVSQKAPAYSAFSLHIRLSRTFFFAALYWRWGATVPGCSSGVWLVIAPKKTVGDSSCQLVRWVPRHEPCHETALLAGAGRVAGILGEARGWNRKVQFQVPGEIEKLPERAGSGLVPSC